MASTIYARSLWRSPTFGGFFLPIALFILYEIFIAGVLNIYIYGLIVLWVVSLLLVATSFNKVVLSPESLSVSNAFYRFWKRTYPWDAIQKVVIHPDRWRRKVYLRVVTTEGVSPAYALGAVKKSQLQPLVEHVRSMGVEVEVSQVVHDWYFNK